MTSRKPLLPRNHDVRREGGKAAKKERYRFALLSKTALAEQLNMILRQADVPGPPVNITEDDLANPLVWQGGVCMLTSCILNSMQLKYYCVV